MTVIRSRGWRQAAIGLLLAIGPASAVAAEPPATPWVDGYNSRARLITGGDAGKLYAGVAIEMADGWKTYWRTPGDSGGVPPNFDWQASENLMSATVAYPAPQRLKDATGDAIGYKGGVVFPVRIVPQDPAKPVHLVLAFEYGICREICVPGEVKLDLIVEPSAAAGGMPAELAAARAAVPRGKGIARPDDPRLVSAKAVLDGDKPRLTLEAEFPAGTAGADAFIEAPDGIYAPQPKMVGTPKGARVTFEAELTTGAEPQELKGKTLEVTLVGANGAASQVSWALP